MEEERLQMELMKCIENGIQMAKSRKFEEGDKVMENWHLAWREYHVAFSNRKKKFEKSGMGQVDQVYFEKNHESGENIRNLILYHLYHTGQIEAACRLKHRFTMEMDQHAADLFTEIESKLQLLRNAKTQQVIDWAELEPFKTTLVMFHLHKYRYLEMIESDDFKYKALSYARKHFKMYKYQYKKEVDELLGVYPFMKKNQTFARYAHLATKTILPQLLTILKNEFFNIHNIPIQSPLTTLVQAGTIAIPSLLSMMQHVSALHQDWQQLSTLPSSIPLPDELLFHNLFCCPISKEATTIENPPMLLKCGHVICKSCVDAIPKQHEKFKCPTCPCIQTKENTKLVHF